MNSQKQSNSESLKALLKSKETAKMFDEALNSPIGSTSRARAKRVLGIMRKLNSAYDGQGGPGAFTYTQNSQPQPLEYKKPKTTRGVVVFHKLPKMDIVYGTRSKPNRTQDALDMYAMGMKKSLSDGRGGPGDKPLFGQSTIANDAPWNKQLQALNPPKPPVPGWSTVPNVMGQSVPFNPEISLNRGEYTPGIVPTVLGGALNAFGAAGNYLLRGGGAALGALTGVPEYLMRNIPYAWKTLNPKVTGGYIDPEASKSYVPYSETLGYKMANNLMSPYYTDKNADVSVNTPSTFMKQNLVSSVKNAQQNTVTTKPPTLTGETKENVPSTSELGTQEKPVEQKLGSGNKKTGGTISSVTGATMPSTGFTMTTAPGSAASVNNISGLRDPQTGAFTQYSSPEESLQATINDLKGKQTGNTGTGLNGNSTLEALVNTWINGNPNRQSDQGYTADDVARDLGITTDTPIGGIDTKQLALSIASHETGFTGSGTGFSQGQGVQQPSTQGATTGQFSNLPGMVKNAVAQGMGPETFANSTIKDIKGMTYGEALDKNKEDVLNEYNVKGLKSEAEKLKEGYADLPTSMDDFKKGRDVNIKKINEAIAEYSEEAPKMGDMSDPAYARKVKQHLDHLYTMRGMYNQNYIETINTSIKQYEGRMNKAIDLANNAVTEAESALQSRNLLTKEEYDMLHTSLTEAYNNIENAPLKALQLDLMRTQLATAKKEQVKNAFDAVSNGDYIKQRNSLKGIVIDNDGYILPNVDWIDVIDSYTGPYGLQADMSGTSVIKVAEEGIMKTLNAPEGVKIDGVFVDNDYKTKIANEAIKQFEAFAQRGLQESGTPNANTYNFGIESAQKIALELAKLTLGGLGDNEDVINGVRWAVETLAEKSFFSGAPKTPSKEDFRKSIATQTKNELGDKFADAIYEAFLRYTQPDATMNFAGGSPESFLEYLLPQNLTPEEQMENISFIYMKALVPYDLIAE